MAVYGYLRVSSAGQASEEKTSLQEQERKIRGIAMMRGDEDPMFFVDPGVSGSIPLENRPEGGKLHATLKDGDILIAAKLDRLFRSAADALATADAMKKRGVGLILADMGSDTVTDGGVAKFFFGMLALMAEFEKSRILERMADGKRAKKAKGGHIAGCAPFGQSIVGKGKDAVLIPNAAEMATIAEACRLRAEGKSYRLTIQALTEAGHLSRAGTPFSPMQIARMTKREAE